MKLLTHPEQLLVSIRSYAEMKALQAKHAAPDIRMKLEEFEIEHPTRRCFTCEGTGVSTWTGPRAGSCTTCHGLRRVAMTTEEMRVLYRLLRARLQEKLLASTLTVDWLVKTFLEMEHGLTEEQITPGYWVYGAREMLKKAVATK